MVFVLDLEVAHGKQDHQRRGDQEDHAEKQEEWIDGERTAEADGAAFGDAPQLPQCNGAENHAQHGHQRVEKFVADFEQMIGEQDAHGKQDEHHLRQQQPAAALLHERLKRPENPVN